MAAAFLIVARLIRLGFLADFLSRTVLIGFLTGVGIQVACGQVGRHVRRPRGHGRHDRRLHFNGTIGKLFSHAREPRRDQLDDGRRVGSACSCTILGLKLVTKKIPGALIAVIGAIFVSWNWDLAAHGVATLGPLPSGLPSLRPPRRRLSDVPALLAPRRRSSC